MNISTLAFNNKMLYGADIKAKCGGRNIFQAMSGNASLAASGNKKQTHHISIKAGYLYSAGNPSTGQEIHMKYDEASSQSDPIMLVEGKDIEGKAFTKKIHLNDIDVENASTTEMTALNVHLAEQGDESIKNHLSLPLATMGNKYDVNDKMNFQTIIQQWAEPLYGIGYDKRANSYKSELERYIFYKKFS